MTGRCRYTGCKGRSYVIILPFGEGWTWVCHRHRYAATVARLRALVAA